MGRVGSGLFCQGGRRQGGRRRKQPVGGSRGISARGRGGFLPAAALPAAALLAGVLMGACGIPGEPLPPLLEIPAPASDLSAVQVGAQIQLRWSRPQLTTEGTRVRFLDRIELHGAFLPPQTDLAGFPDQAQLLATLTAGEISDAPPQIVYHLPLSAAQVGQKVFLAVKAINHKGRDAGFSNAVALEVVDLPDPPQELQASLEETAIRLRWKAAPQSVFGGPAPLPDGYQVFRSDSQASPAAERVGTADSAAYEDTSFQLGSTYVYSVRAFVTRGESTALTPPSAVLEVAAVDRFPPAAPRNVRGVTVPGAIELVWTPNSEPDLAGYNVYRSSGDSFTKLNPELLPIPVFRDPVASAGARYTYCVSASDKNGNESSFSENLSLTAE